MLYSCSGLNSCRCQMQPMSPYGASTSTWMVMSRARWRQNLRSQLPPPGVLCKLLVSAKISFSLFSPVFFQLARILLLLRRRWCDEKRQEVAKEQSSDGKCFCFCCCLKCCHRKREREKVANIQRIIHRIFTHIQFRRIFYDPVGSWWEFFFLLAATTIPAVGLMRDLSMWEPSMPRLRIRMRRAETLFILLPPSRRRPQVVSLKKFSSFAFCGEERKACHCCVYLVEAARGVERVKTLPSTSLLNEVKGSSFTFFSHSSNEPFFLCYIHARSESCHNEQLFCLFFSLPGTRKMFE